MPSDRIALNLKRFKLAATAEEPQRQRIKEDLAFQIPEEQWPADVRAARGATTVGGIPIPARPMLSVAPVDEPIQLVSNQERAAHLGVTFHPLSLDATDDTADILQGLYDQGQNDSNAGTARSWAYERVLWGGEGWYRLVAVFDPEGGHPSDQKIIWKRIKFQGNVYTDPFVQEADKSDRRWQFVIEDVPREDYKVRYPKSELNSLNDSDLMSTGSEAPKWIGGDDEAGRTIRVAEVWEVRTEKTTLNLYSDGETYADGTAPKDIERVTGDGAWSGEQETRKVFWSVMNCYEELEPEQEQDCEWIPLVYACGRELQPFDGKERTVGMIANAKDSARLINYAASGAVEMAALEPKAPFQVDPRQIESYETFWQQSNTRNFPYLPYHSIIDNQVVPPPQRVQVDVSRLGPNMQILSMGGQMLQSAMSTFDPALGKQPTAHRSGVALEALQGQTEQAHSHYLDNLATVSLPYEGRVWLSWAPKVYDRPGRIVRVRDGQGPKPKSRLVMLHRHFLAHPQTGRPLPVDPATTPNAAFIDLKGKFGLSVTVGKSHASLLQEGNDALTAVVQAEPQLLSVIGPEWAMYQDRPGMKQVAAILKKDRDHRMPWLSDTPGDPAQELAQTKQQLAALTQSAQAMKQQLDTDTVKYQMQAQSDIAIKNLESKTQIQIQQMKDATQIEVARITAAKEAMIAEREAAEEAIALRTKIAADAFEADKGRAHEVATTALDHGATLTQQHQVHEQAIAQSAQDNQNALDQADAQRQAAEAAQPSPQADGAGE